MRTQFTLAFAIVLGAGAMASAQVVNSPIHFPASTPDGNAPTVGGPCCPPMVEALPVAPPGPWIRGDYLLWFVKSSPNRVPLVTTGQFNAQLVAQPVPAVGAIGEPTTTVLFGGNSVDLGVFSGIRVEAGIPLGEDGLGFEVGGFLLERRSSVFGARSNDAGVPLIGIPSFDPVLNTETGVTVARASGGFGGFAGRVAVLNSARLWGAEGNASASLVNQNGLQLTGLVGFRYLDLDETTALNTRITPVELPQIGQFQNLDVNLGDIVTTSDVFHTRNQFYGGQVGGRLDYALGDLSATLTAKVALGVTDQRVAINGNSTLAPVNGATVSVPAGLFAVGTNSGVRHNTEFAVVPEVGMNVGYQFNSWLRAQVGYNFLYWSNVARPGDQIDRNVDGRQVPLLTAQPAQGVFTQPAARINQNDLTVHGVNFGLHVSF